MARHRFCGEDPAPSSDPMPPSHERVAAGADAPSLNDASHADPEDGSAALASTGERAVFAWLADEEPLSSENDDTLRGLGFSFDAWGRYGTSREDRAVSRERRVRRLVRQYAEKEYDAALATAERMLRDNPEDPDAVGFAAACRARVEAAHLETLGGRSATFRVAASGRILKALENDPRTRELVERVRRGLSLGEILDLHGSLRLDALQAVVRLVSARILERR